VRKPAERLLYKTGASEGGGRTVKQKQSLQYLYEEYASPLGRFFVSKGVPLHDVEDLVQDAFTVMLRKRSCILDGKAEAFLFGIASKLLMSYNRKALLDRLRRDDGHAVISDRPTEGGDPADTATEDERAELLEKAVSQLAPRMREVINLVYFKGNSRKEVGRTMGIAPDTVYKFEKRALEKLRKGLREVSH